MQISAERTTIPLRRVRREVLWNLPNAISLGRIAASPLLLFYPLFPGVLGGVLFGFGFLAVSLTDLLDGYLARRDGTVTQMGKLLDPLADKLLVMTALILLVGVDRVPLWAGPLVVVLLGRELAVTGLRAMASSEGIVIPAERLGKWKTGFQTAAITGLLVHHPFLGLPSHAIGMLLLVVATVLSVWSGYGYFSAFLGRRA